MVRHYVSPRSRDLLGFPPEDLVGQPAMSFVHPDDIAGYWAAFSDLLDGSRERIVTTLRYRRHDGSYVWTEANVPAHPAMRRESPRAISGACGTSRRGMRPRRRCGRAKASCAASSTTVPTA